MGLVANSSALLCPEIPSRLVSQMTLVLQFRREQGAPTPRCISTHLHPMWGKPTLPGPPEVPPRNRPHRSPLSPPPPARGQAHWGTQPSRKPGVRVSCVCVCVPGPAPPPCPGGARCRGPDPLSSPGHPPALDAPCPAVTPTGKGDFNAAAGSPPPGPAPPRHYDPPADCVPLLLISAVFPLPPPPPRAPLPFSFLGRSLRFVTGASHRSLSLLSILLRACLGTAFPSTQLGFREKCSISPGVFLPKPEPFRILVSAPPADISRLTLATVMATAQQPVALQPLAQLWRCLPAPSGFSPHPKPPGNAWGQPCPTAPGPNPHQQLVPGEPDPVCRQHPMRWDAQQLPMRWDAQQLPKLLGSYSQPWGVTGVCEEVTANAAGIRDLLLSGACVYL